MALCAFPLRALMGLGPHGPRCPSWRLRGQRHAISLLDPVSPAPASDWHVAEAECELVHVLILGESVGIRGKWLGRDLGVAWGGPEDDGVLGSLLPPCLPGWPPAMMGVESGAAYEAAWRAHTRFLFSSKHCPFTHTVRF